MVDVLNRRRFFAASAGLAAGALIGCQQQSGKFSGGISPESSTTFYGDTFDAFATALYGELRKTDGNIFFSPYSISTALAMTATGARGTTLSQMQKVLGLPQDKPVIDALASKGKPVTLGGNRGYELVTANALWPQPGYGWSPEYLKQVTETFQASIHDTDYVSDPEAARKKINEWVEKQTREKIKELLAQGTIKSITKMVLTNAVYFKGDWLEAFDKKYTQDLPFTLLDRSKKNVPLMYRSGKYDFVQNEQVQVARLPYKGKDLSFIGVLPKDPAKFADLDANLKPESFAKWAAGLKPMESLDVWLPKFKIEWESPLNDPLILLGMTDAFGARADFSGMTNSPNGLFVSLVQHKAYVDVNEEGTEAAAATAVVGVDTKMPTAPPQFRADRPFLFALRHEPTGTILFMGRYSNPT